MTTAVADAALRDEELGGEELSQLGVGREVTRGNGCSRLRSGEEPDGSQRCHEAVRLREGRLLFPVVRGMRLARSQALDPPTLGGALARRVTGPTTLRTLKLGLHGC